jgi:PilZ domain
MTTPPVQVERRVGQRFAFLLPVSFREVSTGVEGLGFTQDLSSRGVFFFTETPLEAGAEVELTLNMPSEITLGENMRVRCRGHILRVVKPAAETRAETRPEAHAEQKIGVAVRLEGYEYLPEPVENSATFQRVSGLHSHAEPDRPLQSQPTVRPVLG